MSTKFEKEEREAIFKNRIVYSPPARMGHWFNEMMIQNDKDKVIQVKRDNGELPEQKIQKMLQNLLSPTTISFDLESIRYGSKYQFVGSDLRRNLSKNNVKCCNLYMSAIITEQQVDRIQDLFDGCKLSASNQAKPCMRNTFSFVGVDRDKSGEPVSYGEQVFIKIVENGCRTIPLYVRCQNSTFETFGTSLPLQLSNIPDFYCLFKLVHWQTKNRNSFNGCRVTPNTRLVINHVASGHNLSLNPQICFRTLFGIECELSCLTFHDTRRMETSHNFWKISGNVHS